MKSLITILALCCSLNLFAHDQEWKVKATVGNTEASASFGKDWLTRSSSDDSGMTTYVANYNEGTRRFVVVKPEFFENGQIDYCQLVGGVTPEHDGTISCWAYAYLRGIGAKEPTESVKIIPTGKANVLRSILRKKGSQLDIQLYMVDGGAFVLEAETRAPKHDAFIKSFLDSFSLTKAPAATKNR